MIEHYINKKEVLKRLISLRCKIAERRSQKYSMALLLGGLDTYSVPEKNHFLYSLFPPRKEWVILGEKHRKNKSQVDRNKLRLIFTVRKYRQVSEKPAWYIRLEAFVNHVVRMALDGSFKFRTPKISVLEKKKEKKEKIIICRPICQFKLEERIIGSLYNKWFTDLINDYFYPHSYAFRSKITGPHQMSHLNALHTLIEFRKQHTVDLTVAECDMQKFYDTLDHRVVKKRLNQFIGYCKRDGTILKSEIHLLRSVLYSYVDCFHFYRDVYKYNFRQSDEIWAKVNQSGFECRIDWCESLCHRDKRKIPFGIPQGGALSGLIVNCIMHFTDLTLKPYWSLDTFRYIRFCDDMIMVGLDANQVSKAFDIYNKSITDSKLIPHKAKEHLFSDGVYKFWKGKSRLPYKWGMENQDSFRWITFVGFDVSYKGDVRIRKSTYIKERKKQNVKAGELAALFLKKKICAYSPEYLKISLTRRLTAMSVGRVSMWNYEIFDNSYSWASAFHILNDNKYSCRQLKQLDKNRKHVIARFMKTISSIHCQYMHKSFPQNPKKKRRDEGLYYGKPFSYYYQCLER